MGINDALKSALTPKPSAQQIPRQTFFFPQAQVILFLNKQFTAQAEEKTQQGLWQGKVLQTL